MKNIFLWALLSILLCISSAWAVPQQSHAEIHETITAFVYEQTLSLPGEVTIKVNNIDRRISLPACPALEAFLPSGARLMGNSTVGIRCTSSHIKQWKLFVPVNVKVRADLLIANSTLQRGHVLRAEDIGKQKSELMQAGILTDPWQAIGKVLKHNVRTGQVLKQNMLRAPYVVKRGQTVQIQIKKQGFKVYADGKALNNAAKGQTVRVKTASSQVVSGIAQPGGIVNIRP